MPASATPLARRYSPSDGNRGPCGLVVSDAPLPTAWTIEEHNNACFIVCDSTGHALGYFYFEEEPGRRSAAKLLTKDEARRMAANFAKLPDVLGAVASKQN